MNVLHKISHWLLPRRQVLITILRVITGIVIALKGISFIWHYQQLQALIRSSSLSAFAENVWSYYIIFSSLLSGSLIFVGLLTRFAIILQLPVLIGAVFFINPGEGSRIMNGEFILSIVILALLIYFLLKGPGQISMDTYIRENQL